MTSAYGPLADRPVNPKVGLEIPHESAALHVTGTALYTEDLIGRHKDVLHAWPLQAPHAHARIASLRVDPAYAVPGVVKVLTAADVPGVNDAGEKHDEPLFPDEVMFYGHAVCWVLGETPDAARRGADAIEVDYEPLPSLISVRDAIAADSFQGARRTIRRGDIDQGLAEAVHTFSGELEIGGQEHFYLEGQAALALVDESSAIRTRRARARPTRRTSRPTRPSPRSERRHRRRAGAADRRVPGRCVAGPWSACSLRRCGVGNAQSTPELPTRGQDSRCAKPGRSPSCPGSAYDPASRGAARIAAVPAASRTAPTDKHPGSHKGGI